MEMPHEGPSDVRRLLDLYRLVLQRADALPLFVVTPKGPGRGLMGWLRSLPRPTFGVPTMTTHHLARCLDALLRAYALREATEGLTEVERHDRHLASTFRGGLRPVPWKVIVPLIVLTTLIIGRFTVSLIAHSSADFVPFGSPFDENGQRQLIAMVEQLGSVATLSGSSYGDVLARLGRATPAQLLVLTAGFLAAAYIVIRPFAVSYRVKRVVFNLATQPDGNFRQSSWSWHLPRSAGLYDVERVVFERLDTPVPREFHLDVWTSVVGAAIVFWVFLGQVGNPFDDMPSDRRPEVVWVGGAVVVFALRLWRLRDLERCRARNCEPWLAPAPIALSGGEEVAEVRNVGEVAAWSFGWFVGLLLLVPPIPVWFRLATEVRVLRRAQTLVAAPAAGRARGAIRLRAAMSAMGFLLVPPVSVALHLWRLARTERALDRSVAGTALLWAPALVAVGWLSTWIYWIEFSLNESEGLAAIYGYGLLPQAVAFAMVVALIQREHNWVLRAVGTPLRYDAADPGDAGIPPPSVIPSPRSPSSPVPASKHDTTPAESSPIPRTLAMASIVAVSLAILGTVLPVGFWDGTKTVIRANTTSGDCLRTPPNYAGRKSSQFVFWRDIPWPQQMDVLPCETPHGAEAFFVGDIWATGGAYPGEKAINEKSAQRCDREFAVYVGLPSDQSRLIYSVWAPDAVSWADDDRQVGCVAYDHTGADLKESIRSSRQ